MREYFSVRKIRVNTYNIFFYFCSNKTNRNISISGPDRGSQRPLRHCSGHLSFLPCTSRGRPKQNSRHKGGDGYFQAFLWLLKYQFVLHVLLSNTLNVQKHTANSADLTSLPSNSIKATPRKERLQYKCIYLYICPSNSRDVRVKTRVHCCVWGRHGTPRIKHAIIILLRQGAFPVVWLTNMGKPGPP